MTPSIMRDIAEELVDRILREIHYERSNRTFGDIDKILLSYNTKSLIQARTPHRYDAVLDTFEGWPVKLSPALRDGEFVILKDVSLRTWQTDEGPALYLAGVSVRKAVVTMRFSARPSDDILKGNDSTPPKELYRGAYLREIR